MSAMPELPIQPAQTQTALVTGGAGFLGINLVRYLLARHYKVVSLDIADFSYPERPQITEVKGDIRDRAAVDRAMQGVDLVVHTAAALPLYTPEDIRSTDIDGTRNVIESAHQHGVKRFIHISSTAVYGIPDHHPLLETDKLDGVGDYGKAKIAAENICEEYRAKGMIVTIIRPKSFIGPERLGIFALLYDWAHDKKGFPLPGRGNNLYQFLDVEDLCESIYLCATLPAEKVNDTFNIGAKEFRTIKEDFQSVLDYAGYGKKIVSIPVGPAIAVLVLLNKLKLSPVYAWAYGSVTTESFVSIEKAERILGFHPKFSNQDALRRNYDWYVANLDKFKGQSGVSHRVPWSQGVWTLAKRFF
jgi:nucleoside-diphosphate-sugar epimerase